ncbi:MAG: hypothetical protein RL323_1219 [Pseudomonadota bacterium]|jgi:2-polyprenyl-6-methoxyphenol hydroxylase-like FAD-dependent oxidoreductase
MNKKFDVAIRGGGLVGHTLALLLARERLRVALVTPPHPAATAPDIRAYALNAASQALLEDLRVWPGSNDPNTTAAVTPVQHIWVSEQAAVRFDADSLSAPALSWIVDVPVLEQRLQQAVAFQSGIEVLHEAPAANLTVVCEGKRSATREHLGIEFDTKVYPQTAVAARLRCEKPHGGVARQWFIQGAVLALLPMEGPSGHLVALVWSVPHPRAQELLGAAPTDFAQWVQAACHQALGVMALEGLPAGWPLELSRAKRWVGAGVALAGDAAHAIHPLAGQGLNVGLADVAELARVLREKEYWRDLGDPKLLRRYERARQADFAAMAWVTDGLLSLFGHTDIRIQALRHWGLRNFDRLAPLKHWAARQAMGGSTSVAGR